MSNNFLDIVGFGWNIDLRDGPDRRQDRRGFDLATIRCRSCRTPAPAFPGSLLSTVGTTALSVTGSIIDNFTLSLIIQATQADSRTVTVTAPRVTLFNGQRGYMP